jgi:hypothetical protein
MIYHDTFDGRDCLRKPLGFHTAKRIEDIVNLTRDLLVEKPSQRIPGSPPTPRFRSQLDQRLQRALWLAPAELQEHFPNHRLHPYVDLFIQCAARERLFDYRISEKALSKAEHETYAAARKRMLSALHSGAREPNFRKTVKRHQDKVRRNLYCIERYTAAQFRRHSRLLVIRVDCMFVDGFAAAHEWKQARIYREALINFLITKGSG